MKAKKALRRSARGARGVFALTPLEIEISGNQKPKEKVISTKSEFRNVPGEQVLAKKISGEQRPLKIILRRARSRKKKNSGEQE